MTSSNPRFESIIQEHARLLSRVANTYEANPSIQQELFQEICIAVWQALLSYKGDASLKTYILKVAHNRCVTHVSKELRQFKTHTEEDAATLADQGAVKAPTMPEKDVIQAQSRARLLKAIRQLKLPARQIISLSLEGLSYQEIADVCGISSNNVGVILQRTKTQLQKVMANE